MKRKIIPVVLAGCCCLTAFSWFHKEPKEPALSETYSVGDSVELGGVNFNIYKVDDDEKEIYLLAHDCIASTPYSDESHSGDYLHSYSGSLVQESVDNFVSGLEDAGVDIDSSGLIDKDDLYNLGFEHSDGLSGLPYHYAGDYDFITQDSNFWVDGYCKYETMSWAYSGGYLDAHSCDETLGVRPVIVVSPEILEGK